MPPTKIEAFLFKGENPAHLVTGYKLENQSLRITFSPFGQPETTQDRFEAVFPKAVFTTIEEVEEQGWPLVVIGLDSYSIGERWRFVLDCGTVEWTWESSWPHITGAGQGGKG